MESCYKLTLEGKRRKSRQVLDGAGKDGDRCRSDESGEGDFSILERREDACSWVSSHELVG